MFSGVSLVSTTDAKGSGGCESFVFIAEEVDGVGDKESGSTIIVHVGILLEAFLEDFQNWDYFPQVMCQDFQSISLQIK